MTGSWTPSEHLVADVRHALAHAPRQSPEDRFEAWAWRAMLDGDGPALLTRAATPSHLTASGIILSPDGEQTCLVLHPRVGAWVQPGGHLEEQDSTIAGAAAREVLEETGLRGEVDPVPVVLSRHYAPCRPGEVDWHLDVQHLLVTEATSVLVSSESLDVAWWPAAALPEVGSGVRAGLDRALARLRQGSAAPASR